MKFKLDPLSSSGASIIPPVAPVITGVSASGGGAVDSVNGKTGVVVLDAEDVLPSETGNSGKFLTTDGSTSSWGTPGGGGDMLAATYDPNNIDSDAFNMDNMEQGTTNHYISTAEKTVLDNTSGTNTGDQTSVTGNAGTATKLATARNIDGQSFDGSANITVIAPGTHAATSKTTPVDADELPLVDSAASNILKKLTWANLKATLKTYFDSLYPSGSGTSTGTNTGDQTSVSGNAGTATALQNARTIGGVSFDGTANITVASAIGGFAVSGGALTLGTNDITGVGSIGTTGSRVTKLWATDITATNAIAGSVTGNAATVTTNANLTGVITSSGNATSIASQTGTGTKFVVDTSPTLVTPNLGTPASGVATNLTGTATALNIGGNAATVTTNANLTGDVTSSGNATTIGAGKVKPGMLSTGAAYATVATSESTSSATFTDLTTPGPAVTVTIGANGLALVTVSAELFNNTLGDYAAMGFAISGASTVAATIGSSLYNKASVANNSWRGSYTLLVTGLTAGSTTFTAKYERVTGGTATFVFREISVIPL